jgi:hypothetical protein
MSHAEAQAASARAEAARERRRLDLEKAKRGGPSGPPFASGVAPARRAQFWL